MKKSAFTLIELLIVMAIMAALISISIPAFTGISRGMSMRGVVTNVRSTLSLSRQWAITHRENVTFRFTTVTNGMAPSSSFRVINGDDGTIIQKDVELPAGIAFVRNGQPIQFTGMLTFKPDGGLKNVEVDQTVAFVDLQKPDKITTIVVSWLIGGTRVE